MLEVMNTGFSNLPRTGGDNSIIINDWEKSCPLIKELERTVNFAERKCGDLMQQLSFYKEYYEKWANTDRTNMFCQKKKTKKCCKNNLESGSSSENDFEKLNKYFYNKIKSKISKMNNEISQVNRKLYHKDAAPAPKRHFQKKSISKSKSEDKNLNQFVEKKLCKSEPLLDIAEKNLLASINLKDDEKQTVQSLPLKTKNVKKRNPGPVKKRYTGLQKYKIRSKSLPQGVKRKFGFGGFIEVFDPKPTGNVNSRSKSIVSLKTQSSLSRKSERNKRFLCKMKGNSPKSSRSLHRWLSKSKTDLKLYHQENSDFSANDIKSESVIPTNYEKTQQRKTTSHTGLYQNPKSSNTSRAVMPSIKPPEVEPKFDAKRLENISHVIAKPKFLMPFVRYPIPFIPCSSTSKSFNLGLNVQQVLSLIKHRKHSVTLQTIIKNSIQSAHSVTNKTVPTLNTLFISQTTTSHSQVTSAICPAREASEDSFSIITENLACRSKCTMLKQLQSQRSQTEELKKKKTVEELCDDKADDNVNLNKIERPEDVWVVEQPDTGSGDCKRFRTKCTCFPSKHCMDYHKVLRQYTRWKIPGAKTESIITEKYMENNPMTIPNNTLKNKPKPYSVPSQSPTDCSISENEGRFELIKVHNDLTNLMRKYSSLEQQISQNTLDDYEAGAELEAMESELAVREVEFKDIMNFYNQLMLLKEKLRSLRRKNYMSRSAMQKSQCQQPRKDPFRPTPSMALTNVLRKIQGLQDKIRLIDV